MNRLSIVAKLASEVGAGAPGTTLNQTGNNLRLVNWVDAAWMDIQMAHNDWNWMRTSLTPFPTVAGQQNYSPTTDLSLTDFGAWARDSFRVYDTAAGINSETFLNYIPYDAWRDSYLRGALRTTTSRPIVNTVTPDNSLAFGPITAAGYSIVGDYYKLPTEMAADTDTPILPTQYHMAIVYRAMMHYGNYYAAPEVISRGEAEFTKFMMRLTADRTPDVSFGGAMA